MENLRKFVEGEKLTKKWGLEVHKSYIRWIISNVDQWGIKYVFGKSGVSKQDMSFVEEVQKFNVDGRSVIFSLKNLKGVDVDVKKLQEDTLDYDISDEDEEELSYDDEGNIIDTSKYVKVNTTDDNRYNVGEGFEIEGVKFQTNDKDLAIKYYSIGAHTSQHWAVLPEDYNEVVKGGPGEVIEGFASSFNHHFKRYCTIFGEGEGNFFDLKMEGNTIVVNPPFINSILLRAAEKCLSELRTAKKDTMIVFICPSWYDADFHMMIKRSKFLMKIDDSFHPYIDKITGRIYKDAFKSTWFTLKNYL